MTLNSSINTIQINNYGTKNLFSQLKKYVDDTLRVQCKTVVTPIFSQIHFFAFFTSLISTLYMGKKENKNIAWKVLK